MRGGIIHIKPKTVDHIFNQSIYRRHLSITLSQLLTSLEYKPQQIKEMPPNFKEKPTDEKSKNKYNTRVILKCLRYMKVGQPLQTFYYFILF